MSASLEEGVSLIKRDERDPEADSGAGLDKGVVEDSEFDGQIRQCFDAMLAGSTSDGVSPLELAAFCATCGLVLDIKEFERMVAAAEACHGSDHNGRLTYPVFKHYILHAITVGMPEHEIRESLAAFDTNGDRKVTKGSGSTHPLRYCLAPPSPVADSATYLSFSWAC
eukprot:COSAG05_NODE_2635_length_2817_cov_1.632082_3_plen_168_part_00